MVQKFSIDQALGRAKLHTQKGEIEQAQHVYQSIIAAFPNNVRAKQALNALNREMIGSLKLQLSKDRIDQLTGLYRAGDFRRVIEETASLSEAYPVSFDIWNLKAVSHAAMKQFEAAEICFRAAISVNSKRSDAHFNLGVTLKEQGRLDEAVDSYRRAIALKPDYADAHNNLGMTLKDLGHLDEAADRLTTALRYETGSAEIFYNLSLLKRFKTGDELIEKMHRLYRSDKLNEQQKSFICFALYKVNDDIGEIEEAYRYLSEGNALVRQLLGYQFAQDKTFFNKLKTVSANMNAARVSVQPTQTQPIFILGMPRSGTTLVEQIVSNHSEVHGAGELEELNRLIYPILKQGELFDHETLNRIRSAYLEKLTEIGQGRRYVTDKMPHNFRWIAIIAAAFPEAKIVHVKRDARAVCWSNYKHYFKQKALGYTYDLDDTIAYYRLYQDLMCYLEARVPGRIYHLEYEKLTVDPEHEIRQLITHLGIGWEDSCLEYEKNTRSVKTASTVQVRKKIYQGSSEEWRKYEYFLEPSFAQLKDFQI